MAKNGVKFYRLGLNTANGVERSTYEKYQVSGAMIFAKVNESAGTWDKDAHTYELPAYYIWANGLEYKVADADALKYALEHIGTSEQKLKEIDASIDRLDSSVQMIIDSYVKSLSVDSSIDGGSYVILDPALDEATGDVQLSIGLKIQDVSSASDEGEGLADAYSVKKYVLAKVAEAGHLSYKVVDELPEVGEENVIYLVKSEESTEGDVYQEYMYIDGKWELLGDTSIKLQNYYTKAEVDEKVADLSTAIDIVEENLYDYIEEVEAELDASIKAVDEDLQNEKARAKAKEAEIDSSIEEIKAVDASQEAHLEQLDSSVNKLEEVVLTGVVNSLEVEDKVQSDYVGLAADTSRGNVTVTLSGNVVDASTAEYQGIANNGLATVGYVEERLDQYNWVVVEEDEIIDSSVKSGAYVFTASEDATLPLAVSMSQVGDDASSLSISSKNTEVTVSGK